MEHMRESDLDQVLLIEQASYPRPWTRNGFKTELERSCAINLVLCEMDQVVGYLIFWAIREEIYILNLALRPDRRRQGLGRNLLEYMFDWGRKRGMRRAFLEVRVMNQAARKLYEKTGFVMTGRRKNYYAEEKEDALLMARNL
ncbi:MAG: ribosomal protein S18-alanine N-acetyltransferase [Deltaproteobacteria bacterium]|nr:ribosomal protein S18-alanine N-acetyltransferase [Deltaproteobacteria bacterium]MBW2139670.1 ribosomal protein S18-alanine N-acetyltransferase [Deltaproteobacteria bacterium]MBW2322282.1 ribosomal protein S18-alanine N-acetyltransferase [Deltaproteobacteria bacterium]